MIPYRVDLFLLMFVFEFDDRTFKHTEAQVPAEHVLMLWPLVNYTVPPLHVLPAGTVTVQIHWNYRLSTAS